MGKKGQGGQGPDGGGEAQASGYRPPGAPEDVSFNPEKAKIKANEMDRNGEIIAVLPFDGDMPKGEALREYQEALKTAQNVAEQVNKEAIPRERQDMVRRYMKTLVEPVGGTASTDTGPTDAASTDAAPTDTAPTDAAPTDAEPTAGGAEGEAGSGGR